MAHFLKKLPACVGQVVEVTPNVQRHDPAFEGFQIVKEEFVRMNKLGLEKNINSLNMFDSISHQAGRYRELSASLF